MSGSKKIKNALISVYYKDNLEPVIHQLKALGVKIFSTAGKQKFIRKMGVESSLGGTQTSYSTLFGGRCKNFESENFWGNIEPKRITK